MVQLRKLVELGAWASYDFANQFFVLNIVGLHFVRWVTLEQGAPELIYGLVFGLSTCAVAVLSPILGRQADLSGTHRQYLIGFTLLSVCGTIALGLTGRLFPALVLFAVANIGCQQAVVFYNAIMCGVFDGRRAGLVSGIGKAAGYGGAIFALWCTNPVLTRYGYQAVFALTGVMFLFFSLPCLVMVRPSPYRIPESAVSRPPWFRELEKTAHVVWGPDNSAIAWFLRSGLIAMSVINTVTLFMSVYVTKVFYLSNTQVITFVLYGSLFAFVGSVVSGLLSDRWGHKRMMEMVLWLWFIALFSAVVGTAAWKWVIAAVAGVALGSVWVVSRALVVSLIRPEQAGEAFGMFNLVGYAAGVVGPLLWGILTLLLGRWGPIGYRLTLAVFLPLLIVSVGLLRRMPYPVPPR